MKKTEKKPDSSKEAGDSAGTGEELFDLLIPPGVPRSIIADIIKRFDVQLVERKQRLHFANMNGDEREVLAFRGTQATVEKVQDYMFGELKKFIEGK